MQRDNRIMEAHNPANVAKLPRLMSKWADNELALYQSLVKKHNVDESTFARASIPEGLPPLEPGEGQHAIHTFSTSASG